jgi:hypothetical protein
MRGSMHTDLLRQEIEQGTVDDYLHHSMIDTYCIVTYYIIDIASLHEIGTSGAAPAASSVKLPGNFDLSVPDQAMYWQEKVDPHALV